MKFSYGREGLLVLRFVLCDDNNAVIDKLSKMLEKLFIQENIDAQIVFSSSNPEETLKYILNNPVDVIMIDMQLGENVTGIDLIKKLRKINKTTYVICLSGYMDYVFDALKVKIFDYLLKPISYDKLKNCIVRLINDYQNFSYIYLEFNNSKLKIKQDEINYIEKEKMKSVIHTKNNSYEVHSSLEKIKNCLPDNFARCHKSFIINTQNIEKIDFTKNELSFNNSDSCPIGLKYKNELSEVLKNAKLN